MAVFFSLRGVDRLRVLAVFALEQNLAARAGHLGEQQEGWGEGGEALCLSLIPLQEGLGLRTYSPLLESLFTNYCLKVVLQKFIRADSSPVPPTPIPSVPP